jgi:heterodisulfide reductase subunit A2
LGLPDRRVRLHPQRLGHHEGRRPVTLQTDDADIFAGGDAVTGPATVVEAIEAGKQAAISIDRFIQGTILKEGRGQALEGGQRCAPARAAKIRHARNAASAGRAAVTNFRRSAIGLHEAAGRAEGERCLACGICSECYQCVKACLAGAVDHEQVRFAKRRSLVGAVVLAPGFAPTIRRPTKPTATPSIPMW